MIRMGLFFKELLTHICANKLILPSPLAHLAWNHRFTYHRELRRSMGEILANQDRRTPHPTSIPWILTMVALSLCRMEKSWVVKYVWIATWLLWIARGSRMAAKVSRDIITPVLLVVFAWIIMVGIQDKPWRKCEAERETAFWPWPQKETKTNTFFWWLPLVTCSVQPWWVWANSYFQENDSRPNSLPTGKRFSCFCTYTLLLW